MREASKTLALLTEQELRALTGRGLDIGAGDDPIRPEVQRFDVEHGDANRVTQSLAEREAFDYVFSSHCLEHMRDPRAALEDWWKLVKPGGTLFVVVPDEDLYEQGYWPSLFNSDHKFTFTISQDRSWSPVSCNVLDLVRVLPGATLVSARVQAHGYRRPRVRPGRWPRMIANWATRKRNHIARLVGGAVLPLDVLYRAIGLPVDQTRGNATAQILVVVTKTAGANAPGPTSAQ